MNLRTFPLSTWLLLLALIFQSCGGEGGDDSAMKESPKASSEQTSGEQEQKGLYLNEGDQWQVNEEMKPHIESAEMALREYVAKEREDTEALAEELSTHNQQLIQSCTMKGESHEVLHEWLHPHMELVKALKSADTKEEKTKLVRELEQSFDTYHEYFQ